MGVIIGLIFGVIAAIIAKSKGFKALRWILALGIIGLITVACLSSARAEGITPEEAERRSGKANTVGAVMAWINIGLGVVFFIIVLLARL